MKKNDHTWTTHNLPIITTLLLAFALRIYHLDFQPIWSDEADVIRFANEPLSDLIHNINRPGWNGSLFYLLIRPWLRVVGESPFGLRFFSVIFATASVAAIYVFGKRTLGDKSSTIMSLFVATSPYLVWYAQDGKMYSLLLFLSIISTLALLHACLQENWQAWVLYLILTLISWHIHMLAILLFPFHFLIWTICSRKVSVSRIFILLIVIGILYFPVFRWQFPAWLSPFTTGHQFYELLEIIRIQIFVFTAGYPSPVQLITIPSFLLLFILGSYFLIRIAPKNIVFLLYFVIPLLAIYLISWGIPIYTDRYLIMIAPAFYGLCAIGLTTWLEHRPKILIGVTTLLVLFNQITVYIQANTLTKPLVNSMF